MSTDSDTAVQKVSNEKQKSNLVIKENPLEKSHGEVISKLAKINYYVYEDDMIVDLSTDLGHYQDLKAVAVTDHNKNLKGIIDRKHLFDILGKPYGRDVMKRKPVSKLMQEAEVFNKDRNIFSLAGEKGELFRGNENQFFALIDGEGRFYAIFTSRDMLIYLSEITQKDINLARSLQMSIVKEEQCVNEPALNIIGATRMAKGVGGDVYFIKKFTETKWFFMIADVSGKGVSASLVTTSISGMYGIYDFKQGQLGFVKSVNRYIQNSFEGQKFLTGLIGEFDETTGEFLFYDMGHSYVYIYRDNKLFRLKTNGTNLPMGIMEDIAPTADKIKLEKGDLLILITDGIAEQMNGEREEYGDKRMAEVIKKKKHEGLKAIVDELYQDVYEFRGNQPQHDDMTLLIVEYSG